jgi:arylsulfatase A-like enzyme
LISVDTLRKDALNMRGDNGQLAAPTLHALAEQSLSFERAVTTYPATLFALSSALTGQSPSEVMFAPQPPANLFALARPLLGQPIVALPTVGWFKRSPVPQLLTQGFTPEYFASAEHSTQWMLERLRVARVQKRRSFAWIHFFEPHTSKVSGRGRAAELSNRRSYAGLVSSVDQQIAKLWAALDRLGYLRDSLVIVFSDHGEALGELGYFGHHVYLNQFATDIPLLVHAPGVPARRSQRLVLLSDLAPTVLEWLGLKAPAGDARSLFALEPDGSPERYGMSEAFPVRGKALYDVAREPISSIATLTERMRLIRTAAIDYQPKVSLVSAQYRLIVNRVTGAEEFYDRVRDPTEEHDLSQDGVLAQGEMRQALSKLERRLSERIYCRVLAAETATP